MKKKLAAFSMAAVLGTACVMTPQSVWASNFGISQIQSQSVKNVQIQSETSEKLEKDLKKTADYMMKYLEQSLEAADYQVSYTDYQNAMFAMKAGSANENVTEKLNTILREKLVSYDENFLNPYASSGVQSYALAVAILYLEEQGMDVTSYEGLNLVEKLDGVFLAETEPNPYVYSFISAVATHTGTLSEAACKKVTDGVLGAYVDNETGAGIDYWGVSADNNGHVLTALVSAYGKDADITAKVDKALAWNASQKDESGAIVSWGAPSASATAMAMRAAAQFGKLDEAEAYYKAMEQFSSTATAGAYTYAGEDSIFSSQDALYGMLAYRNGLQNKEMFAVSDRTDVPEESQKPDETTEPEKTPEPAGGSDNETGQTPSGEAGKTADAKGTLQPDASTVTAPETADVSSVEWMAVVMAASAATVVLTANGKKERYED